MKFDTFDLQFPRYSTLSLMALFTEFCLVFMVDAFKADKERHSIFYWAKY